MAIPSPDAEIKLLSSDSLANDALFMAYRDEYQTKIFETFTHRSGIREQREVDCPLHVLGMNLYFTTNALREGTERNFPESKHRSKRVHKKLVKRFGSEFKMIPCILRLKEGIFAHPAFKTRLAEKIERVGRGY